MNLIDIPADFYFRKQPVTFKFYFTYSDVLDLQYFVLGKKTSRIEILM
jgi:hypothetical protein